MKVQLQEAAADMEEGSLSRVVLTGKEVVNPTVEKKKWQRRTTRSASLPLYYELELT